MKTQLSSRRPTFMPLEWSPERAFNPMNSQAKGLTYYEQMVRILGWLDGKNDLPPPIEASLDPTPLCNNKCYYCSSNQYIGKDIGRRWGRDYLEEMISKLIQWGVKGLCWGGRESTLNPNLAWARRQLLSPQGHLSCLRPPPAYMKWSRGHRHQDVTSALSVRLTWSGRT